MNRSLVFKIVHKTYNRSVDICVRLLSAISIVILQMGFQLPKHVLVVSITPKGMFPMPMTKRTANKISSVKYTKGFAKLYVAVIYMLLLSCGYFEILYVYFMSSLSLVLF